MELNRKRISREQKFNILSEKDENINFNHPRLIWFMSALKDKVFRSTSGNK
jgi:hypothetical protein